MQNLSHIDDKFHPVTWYLSQGVSLDASVELYNGVFAVYYPNKVVGIAML